MIIYLHGFRSSPASRKTSMLQARMAALGRSAEYLCPQLPPSPKESIDLVLGAARSVPAAELTLIGSSLGGYYATWLAERIGCRAVLLNPAVAPYRDLQAHLGTQAVYHSDEQIEFRAEHLDELRRIDTPVISRPERYFLIAATGDALIDYRTMVARYAGARQRVIEGSDHELSDFASYIDEVLEFCGESAPRRYERSPV
jgi:hypothetical protein